MSLPLLEVLRQTYDRLEALTRLIEGHNCFYSWEDPEAKARLLIQAHETIDLLGGHLILIRKVL